MKKLSLLIVMLVAMAFGVKAQGHYLIPTVGYNFSNMLASDVNIKYTDPVTGNTMNYRYKLNDKLKMRAGASVGLNYRYEFNKPFLIEVGIFYNNYGFRMNDYTNNNVKLFKDYDYRVTHFSVPIMFGYKFVIGESKVFSVTPKVGVQLGTYLQEYYRYTLVAGTPNNYYYTDYKYNEKFKNGFDVAEIIAVEFGWRVGKILDIFVNVNNRFSYKNLLNEKGYSMYNYTFGANLGLKIRLD